jgi:hypothetical protein
METCPHVELDFGKVAVRAVIDTGFQVFVIAESKWRYYM